MLQKRSFNAFVAKVFKKRRTIETWFTVSSTGPSFTPGLYNIISWAPLSVKYPCILLCVSSRIFASCPNFSYTLSTCLASIVYRLLLPVYCFFPVFLFMLPISFLSVLLVPACFLSALSCLSPSRFLLCCSMFLLPWSFTSFLHFSVSDLCLSAFCLQVFSLSVLQINFLFSNVDKKKVHGQIYT